MAKKEEISKDAFVARLVADVNARIQAKYGDKALQSWGHCPGHVKNDAKDSYVQFSQLSAEANTLISNHKLFLKVGTNGHRSLYDSLYTAGSLQFLQKNKTTLYWGHMFHVRFEEENKITSENQEEVFKSISDTVFEAACATQDAHAAALAEIPWAAGYERSFSNFYSSGSAVESPDGKYLIVPSDDGGKPLVYKLVEGPQ